MIRTDNSNYYNNWRWGYEHWSLGMKGFTKGYLKRLLTLPIFPVTMVTAHRHQSIWISLLAFLSKAAHHHKSSEINWTFRRQLNIFFGLLKTSGLIRDVKNDIDSKFTAKVFVFIVSVFYFRARGQITVYRWDLWSRSFIGYLTNHRVQYILMRSTVTIQIS